MPLDIPTSAQRVVASHFGDELTARAHRIAAEDRVHIVKPPPSPVVARVREGDGHVATVHIDPYSISGTCTCDDDGRGCVHVVATALAILASEADRGGELARAAQEEAVSLWLTELGSASIATAPTAPSTSDRAIAYLLDRTDGDVGLTVVHAARRKSGLGAGTVIAGPGDSARGAPAWVPADDLRRIAWLRAVTRAAPHISRLPLDRVDGELLRDLAGSGRLFWEKTSGPTLAYGPPLRRPLGWIPATDVPSAMRLGIDGVIVLPARECHYLDLATATIGPLDTGVADELTRRLLAAPSVPSSMRATVERSLRALAPTASDSLAPTLDDEPPTLRPLLRASLERGTGSSAWLQLAVHATYGLLDGGDRFELAVWDARRHAQRDMVAEGRHRARYDAEHARLPHGLAATSSLEVLADARHVAEIMIPALRAAGWLCELSDDFPHQAPLADVTFVEELRPVNESRDWFAMHLGVRIAGREVPLLPILLEAIRDGQLVLDARGEAAHIGAGLNVRLPEGELVHIPADRVRRWLRPLIELELRGLDDGELVLPAPVAAELDAADLDLAAAKERLAALLDLAPRTENPAFTGELRPYQRVGLAWLHVLHAAGYGGLLADEMGLGKTVQLLAFLDDLRVAGKLAPGAPALVVAPRSVVGNWQREAARFAPRIASVIHLGTDRATTADALAATPLVITSYQTLLRDIAVLREVPWTTVLLDEAQAVKNPDTQLRTAVATLRASSRFCVTGTPIENHLTELWSEMDLAVPGLVGRRAGFEAVFRRPVEKFGLQLPLERLRARIRPFLLRRTKETVELELPPKTEIVELIDLDTAQRDLYESLRLILDADVRKALAARGIHGASLTILDALLKLRQCCCDPRLLKIPEARAVKASAKLERLMEMLEELADSGRSTLVFSQFTSMLSLIETACDRAGIATARLTGATRDRDAVIRRFQDGEVPVFLISLKAGGVGLNLTRADTVIHVDPWWNPAAEAQATGRAHRIGQDRHVMVYKLVARGTLEESILALQDEKRALTQAALRDGDVTHLGESDLASLFRRLV